MRFQTLPQWLSWQQQLHPNEIELGLDRVRRVAQRLDLLNPDATVITVAGTNGKGSCITSLSSLLSCSGQSYGAFTSPHIQRYNERISVDGEFASDALLCEAFHAIDGARGDISLTYFEFGALAAFYVFEKRQVDYWLIEVGLGGRLDASNVLDADIAIITSIALDHMEWLGDTREKIGAEKAGICRAGAPLISAEPDLPESAVQVATKVGAQLLCLGETFGFEVTADTIKFWGDGYHLSLSGTCLPVQSLAAACQAYHLLRTSNEALLPVEQVCKSLVDLKLPGRFELVDIKGGLLVLDVAHNPAAMAHLCEQLERGFPGKKVAVVLAMMRDKNIQDSVENLHTVAGAWYISTIEGLERAATARELGTILSERLPQARVELYGTVVEAIDKARAEFELVLVTGSFYCVEAAKEYIQQVRGA